MNLADVLICNDISTGSSRISCDYDALIKNHTANSGTSFGGLDFGCLIWIGLNERLVPQTIVIAEAAFGDSVDVFQIHCFTKN